MRIEPYKPKYFCACIKVFDSNIGKYFAKAERREFEEYLSSSAEKDAYFVVIKGNDVVACGGYQVHRSIAGLSWGMVNRCYHGESIGKQLLLHRIEHMKEHHGDIAIYIDTSQHTQGFYSKHGFETVAIEKDGYEKGLDKIFMKYHAGTC